MLLQYVTTLASRFEVPLPQRRLEPENAPLGTEPFR